MAQLKEHYESQLKELSKSAAVESTLNNVGHNEKLKDSNLLQSKVVLDKMNELKGDLIGGERVHDVILREKHKKKKLAAENRLR